MLEQKHDLDIYRKFRTLTSNKRGHAVATPSSDQLDWEINVKKHPHFLMVVSFVEKT
jgi:hypothetical protein